MSVDVSNAGARPGSGRQGPSTGVQATLAVLGLLAAQAPLGLSEISRELGIAKSTLHRNCGLPSFDARRP